ncbi:hypothetical protein [Enterococcus sp. 5H]|nr:hypothetical protein [Enterococcus sp. 5H]MDA9470558.1 hypothetical protein [Enterococcus sp. 5H]
MFWPFIRISGVELLFVIFESGLKIKKELTIDYFSGNFIVT